MQAVGLKLLEQADAAALLASKVNNHATFGVFSDCFESKVKLGATLALERTKRFAGDAFAVHAHQYVFAGRVSGNNRNVVGCGSKVIVTANLEGAVHGWKHGFGVAADASVDFVVESFWQRKAVLNQLLDCDYRKVVGFSDFKKLVQTRHGSVWVHYLADYTDRLEAGKH